MENLNLRFRSRAPRPRVPGDGAREPAGGAQGPAAAAERAAVLLAADLPGPRASAVLTPS